MIPRDLLLAATLPLAWACVGDPKSTAPIDSPPAPPVESDPTPAETPTVTALTVTITPPVPAFDQDLRCEVAVLTAGQVTVGWLRDGVAWLGQPTTTTLPGDTIPHLLQAGGQRWRCRVEVHHESGALVASGTSSPVTVEPPVPMVVVPPGSYANQGLVFSLSRPYLMGRFELTVGDFLRHADYRRSNWPEGEDYPAGLAYTNTWLTFADHLSRLDGLEPCFECTGAISDNAWSCTMPADAYACEGYRYPTLAEWEHAAREAGRHDDMLPAGGDFMWLDWEPANQDPEATGPNAPPDSHVSDQCQCGATGVWAPAKVGQLLPNSLGLFDMCGNQSEFVLVDVDTPRTPGMDEYLVPRDLLLEMGGSWGETARSIGNRRRNANAVTDGGLEGARLVRTLVPFTDEATQ